MPKYLNLASMSLEFGKNIQAADPNIKYRYFKVLFDANIPNNAFFTLHGSPAILIQDLPLYDFNSTTRQVTNFVGRRPVTIETSANNGQNVRKFRIRLLTPQIKIPLAINGSPATMNLFREFKEESLILSCWFNPDQVDENSNKNILLKLVGFLCLTPASEK